MSALPPSVLFACSHNSIRSPMAEGLAKRLYGNTAYMESVGVHAGALDSFAAAVLDELGIDLFAHRGKSFDDVDPSSDPVCSRHEVVANERNASLFHISQQ